VPADTLSVPPIRIRRLVDGKPDPAGRYVLYWMIAFRRTRYNFALQRAVEWSRDLSRPLVVLEALGCAYPWASDRHHAFVIDGMRDNAARFGRAGVVYLPYVEPRRGAGRGLFARLAKEACVVVTDDYPEFALPRLVARAAGLVRVRFECVDGNGLLPLADTPRVFGTAFAFRRHAQTRLPVHLDSLPRADPLRSLPRRRKPSLGTVPRRWPPARLKKLGRPGGLSALPIDHAVAPVAETTGGSAAARRRLRRFIAHGLSRYARERNHPDAGATSGLSPYLHFGHIASHEVFLAVVKGTRWSAATVGKARGRRAGWWRLDASREAFLDQLVTWRELGFNMSRNRPGHARYDALPPWALGTLETHASDERDPVYGRGQFEAARTHDPVWNAAQTQLVREGTIAGYLRMVWGKKILEWSRSPRAAVAIMIALNDKYALDGRDPNSYSGIFWCLGRYDRPWGPERPIFGKVRFMTTAGALRKTRMKEWLSRFGAVGAPAALRAPRPARRGSPKRKRTA